MIFEQLIDMSQPGQVLQWLGLHQFELAPPSAADTSVLSRMGNLDYPLPLSVLNYFVFNATAVADSGDAFSFNDCTALPRPLDERFLLEEEALWCLSICSENSFEVIQGCCR